MNLKHLIKGDNCRLQQATIHSCIFLKIISKNIKKQPRLKVLKLRNKRGFIFKI